MSEAPFDVDVPHGGIDSLAKLHPTIQELVDIIYKCPDAETKVQLTLWVVNRVHAVELSVVINEQKNLEGFEFSPHMNETHRNALWRYMRKCWNQTLHKGPEEGTSVLQTLWAVLH